MPKPGRPPVRSKPFIKTQLRFWVPGEVKNDFWDEAQNREINATDLFLELWQTHKENDNA